VANHLGDERVSDVGPNELRASHPALQVFAGRDRVDCDDPVDHRVLREPGGQVPAEEAACTRHQDHFGVMDVVCSRIHAHSLTTGAAHRISTVWGNEEVTCRVSCAAPACDEATCGASSSTCACAAS